MTYDQLVALLKEGNFARVYKALKARHKPTEIKKLKAQWDSTTHDVVVDTHTRRDKSVVVDVKDADGNLTDATKTVTVFANRVPIPFQKRITNTAVSFIFGNPVSVSAPNAAEPELPVIEYIKKIFKAVKTGSIDRLLARNLFRSTEIAEVWHFKKLDKPHEKYGFSSAYDIRLSTFSNWDGSLFYPYFDGHGDMIAFGREYVVDLEDSDPMLDAAIETTYCEVYTKDFIYVYRKTGINADWVEGQKPAATIIGAMPIVYGVQELAEWEDVQRAIERLETLISNHADINDYNGSPVMVASGQVMSMSQKGETGKLLELAEGAKLEYLSWDSAPVSIKMEIEDLFMIVYTFTNTPNLSPEAIKGMTSISGIALKLLFMDAHLKVMDKREIFDPYLDRRVNVLKAILAYIKPDSKSAIETIDVQVDIKPYMIEDLKELVATLVVANGGKAVASQKTTVALSGLTIDPEAEFDQIQAEETAAREAEAEILSRGAEPTL